MPYFREELIKANFVGKKIKLTARLEKRIKLAAIFLGGKNQLAAIFLGKKIIKKLQNLLLQNLLSCYILWGKPN